MGGQLIAIEGIDGTGKSTLAGRLANLFESSGISYLHTREPGGTQLGENIRSILLSTDENLLICLEAELLLFHAARAQHVREVIAPALARGINVITDRFCLTTQAYQGAGSGLSEIATTMRPELMKLPTVDHLIILDCDPRQIRSRLLREGKSLDRFEQNSFEYFDRARAVFMEGLQSCESSILINAEMPADAVYYAAKQFLMNAMYERTNPQFTGV